MTLRAKTAVAMGLMLSLLGCETDASVCAPGERVSCEGPGGCAGAQTCSADRQSFGACLCAADAGSDLDAGQGDAGLDAGPRDDGGAPLDAGDLDAGSGSDAGLPVDAGECFVPSNGYGTSVGRNLLPFTLDACDGTPFEFYSAARGYCASRFTVINVTTGWCGPCRAEAAELEAQVNAVYGPRGVRVLTVLLQDNDYRAPDLAFCGTWTSTYGLTNPVLIDPAQELQLYFPGGALPANLIVDDRGVIRHREYGYSAPLGTVRAQLDALLAMP